MEIYRTIKSAYKHYDAETGTLLLGTIGGLAGGVAGAVVPPYIGWKLGAYAKELLELGKIGGLMAEAMGAIGLVPFIKLTVPAGIISGQIGGGIAGAITGKSKESLEKIISKNLKVF